MLKATHCKTYAVYNLSRALRLENQITKRVSCWLRLIVKSTVRTRNAKFHFDPFIWRTFWIKTPAHGVLCGANRASFFPCIIISDMPKFIDCAIKKAPVEMKRNYVIRSNLLCRGLNCTRTHAPAFQIKLLFLPFSVVNWLPFAITQLFSRMQP